VSYGYDSLNRLISASASSGAWGQSFTYDGFGNLLQKTVTQGSAPTLSVAVDPATNRIVGQSYDANGNLLYNGAVYDALNRVWQIYQYGSLNTEGYAYGPNNERVEKVITANGTSNYYTYLYGVDGCRLGVYQPAIDGTGRLYFQGGSAITPCFGGRMLYTKAGQLAVADRLGSIRPLNGSQTGTTSYYPYGEEQPQQSTEDTERFATYYRDSTNLDYAKNRYYTNQFGRFLTPDPSTGVNLGDPRTWNKYTYVGGDPVNYNDPNGEMMAVVCGFGDCGDETFGPLIGPLDWYFWVGNGGDRAYPDPLGEPKVGGGGGGSGLPEPYYQKHPCDRNDPTNARIFNFLDVHRDEAQELASQVNVPWEWILGVSAEETTYGTEGTVTKGTNNFFGLHVDDVSDTSHYLYQVGVYKTLKDGYVATFSGKTGFLDSGVGFLSIEKTYIEGLTNLDAFARAIHAHGYGTTNPDYVSQLTDVVGLLKAREDCPR